MWVLLLTSLAAFGTATTFEEKKAMKKKYRRHTTCSVTEQADEILEDMEVSMGRRKKRQAYRDNKYPATLWSNGINYAFWNASNAARRVFVIATEIWRDNTCLKFREDSSASDKVWVTDGAGCWAHLGRIGGTQFMSLGDGCGYIGLGLHELCHTIGLYHTQSRHNRDNYITLHHENLAYDWHDQFNKESESTNYNYNITYDYGTVMHYSGASPWSVYFLNVLVKYINKTIKMLLYSRIADSQQPVNLT
ncbi:Astacin (Peptidase M12A) [Parelaphostrongylus tenuis]|uniref:Metalloendopeptidase n=1 Tax=Parelaphostrongylus tenuis TaxID=148309 RepID=A0AAD5N682_PARTN|nr:Astacin (Peptidase M12A) [Parelaphostrongylus tenuis]